MLLQVKKLYPFQPKISLFQDALQMNVIHP